MCDASAAILDGLNPDAASADRKCVCMSSIVSEVFEAWRMPLHRLQPNTPAVSEGISRDTICDWYNHVTLANRSERSQSRALLEENPSIDRDRNVADILRRSSDERARLTRFRLEYFRALGPDDLIAADRNRAA